MDYDNNKQRNATYNIYRKAFSAMLQVLARSTFSCAFAKIARNRQLFKHPNYSQVNQNFKPMKIYIIRIFSLICSMILWFNGMGQAYYPIVDTNNIWNSLQIGFGSMGVVCGCTTISNKVAGDTIINNMNYYKVLEANDSLQSTWTLKGFIREDLVHHQVYYRNLSEEEGLLYDFDIAVNDTLIICNTYGAFPDSSTLKCELIDTVNINGTDRPRYVLGNFSLDTNYSVYDTWIQGIGSLHGILSSGHGLPDGTKELLCCTQNDTLLFINPEFNTCYKDIFYPLISSDHFDTAFVNTYYEFQVQSFGTTANDSIVWYAYNLPPGLAIDQTNGLIYGSCSVAGNYDCLILVANCTYLTSSMRCIFPVTSLTHSAIAPRTDMANLFPNPTPGKINLVLVPNRSGYIYQIYSQLGLLIEEKRFYQSPIRLDYSELPRGVYIIAIRDYDSNNSMFKRLILN